MSQKSCVIFGEICRDDVPIAGGKGANLGDMVQADLPVPPGFVICAPAYRHLIKSCGLKAKIAKLLSGLERDDNAQLQDVEEQIRHFFKDIPITDELSHKILERYRALGDNVPVAVRSSATAEDLAGASFAGQQETYLNVVGETALFEAIRRCWSSLYTSQAMFYRRQRGFGDVEVSMAIVVQKMINAQKSGVSFTVDPVMRNHYQMVIEAVWGLGEGIVSGTITPDHYKLDRETYEIAYEFIPDKKVMFCYNQNSNDRAGGIVELPVPADRVSAKVLADTELQHLVDLGNQVEEHFGCPQDIEWAIEDNDIYLLQSRPITSL